MGFMQVRGTGNIYGLAFALILISIIFISGCVEHRGDALAQKAMAANNPGMCNNLTEQRDRSECFRVYADTKAEPSVCLMDAADSMECISRYAARHNTMTVCDLFKDAAKKYECVARFTGDQTGRALDTIIADWKTNGRMSMCIKQCSAERTRCVEKCARGDHPCINICDREYYDTCEPGCRDAAG
jgi:hypothetical protein